MKTISIVLLLVASAHAWIAPRVATTRGRAHAALTDDRRGFLAESTAAAAAVASTAVSPAPALADDSPTVVTFDVQLSAEESGTVTIELHPEWAPLGAARFEELVRGGLYDECRFFRVLPNFVAQFGINGDPAVSSVWRGKNLKDDKVQVTNKRGTLTFATGGPNTRTTQVFINLNDNAFLDKQGFSPFATVTSGMDVVNKLYSGYGEGAPSGRGPNQGQIQFQGNSYLKANFPLLSYIKKASVQ